MLFRQRKMEGEEQGEVEKNYIHRLFFCLFRTGKNTDRALVKSIKIGIKLTMQKKKRPGEREASTQLIYSIHLRKLASVIPIDVPAVVVDCETTLQKQQRKLRTCKRQYTMLMVML